MKLIIDLIKHHSGLDNVKMTITINKYQIIGMLSLFCAIAWAQVSLLIISAIFISAGGIINAINK